MGMRNAVIKLAKSQIGLAEPTGDDKFISWYNSVTGASLALDSPWCAMFASWVYRNANVPTSSLPTFASCTVAVDWAKKNKLWYSRLTNYTPKPGVVIMFDWNTDGRQDHAGIVETVTANQITVIEGNTSDSVGRRTYSRTSKYILGYIDVPYPDEDSNAPTVSAPTVDTPVVTKPTVSTPTPAVQTMSVKEIQQYIATAYGLPIAVDGAWGSRSKKAMAQCVQTVINKEHGGKLIVDGAFGTMSKKSMPILKVGAIGTLVQLVQMCLILKGAKITVSGKMDAATLSAVEEFQTKSGLLADKEVGPDTMAALLK